MGMPALVATGDATQPVRLERDLPVPEPRYGELIVQVNLAGVCATDLEILRGYMHFSGVLGHEFVGTVVAGPPAWYGKRVVGEINCPCGDCEACQRGLGNHCPHRTVLGIAGRDGVFAEFAQLPVANCHAVPDDMPDDVAVFVEPVAAAAHVLDELPADARATELRAAVLGTGRLGLLTAQVLRRAVAELDVIGRNPRTLELARAFGLCALPTAEVPRGPQYDFVVDCTGTPEGLRLALELCRPRGTLVLKSTYAGAAAVNLAPVVVNEIRVLGSRCGEFPRALELLRSGRVRVTELISGVFALADGLAALKAARKPGNVKILLRPPCNL